MQLVEFNKRKEKEKHLEVEQNIVERDIKEFESEVVKKDAIKHVTRIVMQNQMKKEVDYKQKAQQERIQQEAIIDEQNKMGPGWM